MQHLHLIVPEPQGRAQWMTRPALPTSLKAAMLRGARSRCPRCEGAALFARYLKPEPCCPACGQDWTAHQADDFPPYLAIFVTGHVLAPVMIGLAMADAMPMWAEMAIALVLAAAMLLSLLQPAKGAVIALQWWMGMHGFKRGGRDELAAIAAAANQT